MKSYKRLCGGLLAAMLSAGIVFGPSQAAFAMSNAEYLQLKEENQGQLAEIHKFIPTTEQSVIFTFGGFSKTAPLHDILEDMASENMRGTFFVTDRDLRLYADNVEMIHRYGQDMAIGIRSEKGGTYESYCKQIDTVRTKLKEIYGVETNIARQMSGADDPLIAEAARAMGCELYGQTTNLVLSKHQNAQSVDEIYSNLLGKRKTSLSCGNIVHIRVDYYTRDDLVADVMMKIKHEKIDNIAYRSYTDTPETNAANDSAYRVASLQDVLDCREKIYQYPVDTKALPEKMQPEYHVDQLKNTKDGFRKFLLERYIGAPEVRDRERMLWFSTEEIELADKVGIIKNVPDNTIFLTFDDWGMDNMVNHILYVLRKHKANGTFYIITLNSAENPNLLRAIAEDGNEVGCHTDRHKAMALTDPNGNICAGEAIEEYKEDVASAYPKLLSVVGDVKLPNGRYALTRQLRPPTLALNRKGVEAIFDSGYEYIVNGYGSTEDYAAVSMQSLVGIMNNLTHQSDGKVRRGAIVIMHMSAWATKTARALDIFLTANDNLPDGDPRKFKVGLLGDYLKDGYRQDMGQVREIHK